MCPKNVNGYGKNIKVNAKQTNKKHQPPAQQQTAFKNCQHSFSRDKTLFKASSNILKEVSHAQVMSLFP